MDRYESVMEGAAIWGAFYRANPDKFAEDYLHIQLRLFQRILLAMMFWSTTFVLIACRGLGKTYISAIYCVVRCILYPGTKICIASGTRGQAINVLEKILLELKPQSEELRAEIDDKQSKINGTNAQIVFFNTSVIKVWGISRIADRVLTKYIVSISHNVRTQKWRSDRHAVN